MKKIISLFLVLSFITAPAFGYFGKWKKDREDLNKQQTKEFCNVLRDPTILLNVDPINGVELSAIDAIALRITTIPGDGITNLVRFYRNQELNGNFIISDVFERTPGLENLAGFGVDAYLKATAEDCGYMSVLVDAIRNPSLPVE